ncbi:MAG TPA: hypothetical protein ENK14_07675 [Caldithrix sp.]|nr:hypothetical protein [Caldithrix sp.]
MVNNRLGFTTNYMEGRSSTYCTDVGKVTLSPVFHINADDVEAVVYAIQIAMEYRQMFHTDVFIDLLGYCKYGHNEGDEPRFTQPKLYKVIARHPDPREIYNRKLLQSGSMEKGLAEEMEREFKKSLQLRLEQVKEKKRASGKSKKEEPCDQIKRAPDFDYEAVLKTTVPQKTLLQLAEKIYHIQKEVKVFPKVRKLYEAEKAKLIQMQRADWAAGEFLTYATLLNESVSVRLTGQDTERGTFSHCHAVLYNTETEEKCIPIRQVETETGRFFVYNSLLSEYTALGFEYGYSCAMPNGLTIWEA